MLLNPLLRTNHFKMTRISIPSCTDVSKKKYAETSKFKATHPADTEMNIAKL